MSTVTIVSCDLCGRTASFKDNGISGWITIQQRQDKTDDPLTGWFGFGSLRMKGEVCSWDCLAKYATARVLIDGASQ